jgi:hypothetical protein
MFRSTTRELSKNVASLDSRLKFLSDVFSVSVSRLETNLRESSASMIVVRENLLAARRERDCAIDELVVTSAATSATTTAQAAEINKLEAELSKISRPLMGRDRGVICLEVRAAAVEIAAGLEVSICAVSLGMRRRSFKTCCPLFVISR